MVLEVIKVHKLIEVLLSVDLVLKLVIHLSTSTHFSDSKTYLFYLDIFEIVRFVHIQKHIHIF